MKSAAYMSMSTSICNVPLQIDQWRITIQNDNVLSVTVDTVCICVLLCSGIWHCVESSGQEVRRGGSTEKDL